MSTIREQFAALVRFEIDLWNAVERRLRQSPGAVSLARRDILALTSEPHGARVQDVADSLRITVGAASRLTDRMENDALVERRPHPTDRRSSRIHSTEAGTTALSLTEPAIDAALDDILGDRGRAALGDMARAIAAVEAELESGLEPGLEPGPATDDTQRGGAL